MLVVLLMNNPLPRESYETTSSNRMSEDSSKDSDTISADIFFCGVNVAGQYVRYTFDSRSRELRIDDQSYTVSSRMEISNWSSQNLRSPTVRCAFGKALEDLVLHLLLKGDEAHLCLVNGGFLVPSGFKTHYGTVDCFDTAEFLTQLRTKYLSYMNNPSL